MKTPQQLEVEMCSVEAKCPNCGSWLAFPWWNFVLVTAGRCGCCGSYHRNVDALEQRPRERS